MCKCVQITGGEFDEILTVACDECLDRESADALIEAIAEEAEARQEHADLQRELIAEWTGANLMGVSR